MAIETDFGRKCEVNLKILVKVKFLKFSEDLTQWALVRDDFDC